LKFWLLLGMILAQANFAHAARIDDNNGILKDSKSTGAQTIPSGTTWQRPACSGSLLRCSTTLKQSEYCGGTGAWAPLAYVQNSGTSPWWTYLVEQTGDAGVNDQNLLNASIAPGFTLHPALTASERTFLANNPSAPFIYFAIPPLNNSTVASCLDNTDPNADSLLRGYSNKRGNVWRLGMPEFDQAGGCWTSARPSFAGRADLTNYNNFVNYYKTTLGLSNWLNEAWQRGYKFMAVADYCFGAQYGYDMGVDLILNERTNDELAGITPGLMCVRGAANQHGGKDWGIDSSGWRFWSNAPTSYNKGHLVKGWSIDTFKRNLYIAYMGGANIVHIEAFDLVTGAAPGQTYNPMGLLLQGHYDFTLIRHTSRGLPYVPMAFMQDHYSGFDGHWGYFNNNNAKWYYQNAYTSGDQMLANLLALEFPGYGNWGTLGSFSGVVHNGDGSINVNATVTNYNNYLAGNGDPRPYEPFGNARWGETFDIITNAALASSLNSYKVIILTANGVISDSVLATLTAWVKAGGTLIINAQQMSTNSQTLAGVTLTANRGRARSSTWVADGSTITEASAYNYQKVTLTTAANVAYTGNDPVITKNAYGAGTVYVTTPDYMENATATTILNVGSKLIDTAQLLSI
jgi:hypothetical protein